MPNRYLIFTAIAVILLGLAVRLMLLGGPPDIPDWRQADTGYMALRMMDENPPDLLHPKAPYRGAMDVKAAEFPIYPFTVSLFYKIAGAEVLSLARLATLLYFAGSALYLGLATARLFGGAAGWLAAAVFVMLPLGIPYSRMIHPDFCIMFFANGFFYHAVAYFQSRRIRDYFWSVVLCSGLFLMKAPYGFYYGFPLGVLVLQKDLEKSIKDLVVLAALFVIPLALGMWFNDYRIRMEAPYEESLVYPLKWTNESVKALFFGTLEQRFDTGSWMWLFKRSLILVFTLPGAVLAAIGMFAAGDGWRDRRRWLLWSLAFGLLAYTLLVFPKVSSDHEYYSIPFMILVAIAAAVAMERLSRFRAGLIVVVLAWVLLIAGSYYGIQRGPFLRGSPYFTQDAQRIETARMIRENTPADALVVSVTVGRSTGWSDPRILWLANRRGWSIEGHALSSDALQQFREAGGAIAAVLMTPGRAELDQEIPSLAMFARRTEFPLSNARGEAMGLVVLVNLEEP